MIKNELILKSPYTFLKKEFTSLNKLINYMLQSKFYRSAVTEWLKGELPNLIERWLSLDDQREKFAEIRKLFYPGEDDGESKSAKIQLSLTQILLDPHLELIIDGVWVGPNNLNRFIGYFFSISRSKKESGLITSMSAHDTLAVYIQIAEDSLLVRYLKKIRELSESYNSVIVDYPLLTGKTLEQAFCSGDEERLKNAAWLLSTYEELKSAADARGLEFNQTKAVKYLLKCEELSSLKGITKKLNSFKNKYIEAKGDWALLYYFEELSDIEALLLLSAPEDNLVKGKLFRRVPLFLTWSLSIIAMTGLLTVPYMMNKYRENNFSKKNYLGVINGEGYDIAKDALPSGDGGWIIGGHTSSVGYGANDIWLFKVDNQGVLEWSKTVGGPGDEIINVLGTSFSRDKQPPNYYLGGKTTRLGSQSREFSSDSLLVKFDNTSRVIWKRIYNMGGDDEINGLVELLDGQVVFTGKNSSQVENDKIFVAMVSSQGDLLWNYIDNKFQDGHGVSVLEGKNNDVLVFGTVNENNHELGTVIYSFDLRGNLIWRRLYHDLEILSEKVILSVDDGVLFVGNSYNWDEDSSYVDVIKIDYKGNHVWNTRVSDQGVVIPVMLSPIILGSKILSFLLLEEEANKDQLPKISFINISENGKHAQINTGLESQLSGVIWGEIRDREVSLVGVSHFISQGMGVWVHKAKLPPDSIGN